MTGLLEGRVAVVTGAARGQGRSHCVRLAEEGADIIALDICDQVDTVRYPLATEGDLGETVKLVEGLGRRIVASQTDVRDSQAVRAAVDHGVTELGRLDTVVANAGILTIRSATEIDDAIWSETIDTNLTGAWNVCRASIHHLIDAGRGGAMILKASRAADKGAPGLVHYCASKGGLVGLMRGLAAELGPHMIRVNTVHPTSVDTEMIHNEPTYGAFLPNGPTTDAPDAFRTDLASIMTTSHALPVPWLEPVDVSNMVVFLASDMGRYISGSTVSVSAGNECT